MKNSFPKQNAATQHFTLGAPRSFALSISGQRVFFLRSGAGNDVVNCLWMIDLATDGKEQLIANPRSLQARHGNIPLAEKRRRERLRELGGGIVSFSIDNAGATAAFVLAGDLYVVQPGSPPFALKQGQGAYDPHISPDGRFVAYVAAGDLFVIKTQANAQPKRLAHHKNPDVTWGQADFIASEEIHRSRGYWWSPDSTAIIASKVDNTPVQNVFIANPANPTAVADSIRYPFAGTPNAITELAIINVANGKHTTVTWDAVAYPYVVHVDWGKRLVVTVQSRSQKQVNILQVNVKNGATRTVYAITDQKWIELIAGSPQQTANGHIVHTLDGTYRNLAINNRAAGPSHLHVAAITGSFTDGTVVFAAYDTPRNVHAWMYSPDGTAKQITKGEGLYYPLARGNTCVIRAHSLHSPDVGVHIYQKNHGALHKVASVASHAAAPVVTPRPVFYTSKKQSIQTALLLPSHYDGKSKLPVLMDPYGGPGLNTVVAAQAAYREAQWLADQGFAVIIADGRGTPGRDVAWEKAIAGDLVNAALQDQIEALHSLAAHDNRLDVSRVAIRGWSFGGYLAAYAVVRHPEIFCAAIAGAPVTEWRMYDTHYTERYLGDPATNQAAYDACSLLQEAHKLERPLLLIHGFADDNVLVANTLQFSATLTTHGRPHQVLPLSNTTHMPSQPQVAEHLMTLQLDFLRRYLPAGSS